jgi:hypothetical protein
MKRAGVGLAVKHAHKVVSFPVFNNEINIVRTTSIEQSVQSFKETRGQLSDDYDFKNTSEERIPLLQRQGQTWFREVVHLGFV